MSTKRNNYKTVSSESQNIQAAWEDLTDEQAEALQGGINLGDILGLLGSGTSGQWLNTEIPGVLNLQSGSGGLGGIQGQTTTAAITLPFIGAINLNWGNFGF